MVDSKIIAKNFSGACKNYDEFAILQRNCAKKICDLSADFIKKDDFVLDLGSGTSFIAKNLCDKNLRICELDLSFKMLESVDFEDLSVAKINADIKNLPFKNSVFDVAISSFALQWVENFDKLFASLNKILKNNSILAFALPVFGSFEKIIAASKKSGCDFDFHELPKSEKILNELEKNDFKKIIFFEEEILISPKNAVDFLKNIKKIGARGDFGGKFVSKKELQKFNDFFLKESYNKDIWKINYFLYQKF